MVDVSIPQLDLGLSELPKIYREAQMQRARQDSPLLSQFGGDMGLAQLFMQQQRLKQEQSNTDRSFGLEEKKFNAGIEGAKIPPGFERDPATGGHRPIKGGVADPAYIQASTEAKDKGRPMSAGEITKLTEEGGKFTQVKGFIDTFDDKFAGHTVLGDARNWVGRNLPEAITDPDARKGAEWWQNYDRYKNVVRNDLFGSALTATEQAAFTKADITPNMAPSQVRANLDTQHKVLETAMKRKAGALISEGFRPETVARGYGVKLEDFGISTTKKGAKPAASDQPPVPGAKQGRKPDGSLGWFIQRPDGKTYLVE